MTATKEATRNFYVSPSHGVFFDEEEWLELCEDGTTKDYIDIITVVLPEAKLDDWNWCVAQIRDVAIRNMV